ncbi:MAG TPA: DNA-processing protein DprA [Candidatus Saccharimonadales bacterium]|nr:DNA-processing protein DprA [Candidatus Saccharimonadales bacterium]
MEVVQEDDVLTTHSAARPAALFPAALRHIPSPPQRIYFRGPLNDLMERPRLAVVGSRSISPYGRQITEELAGKLAERGMVIVSGLALGVDAAAHRAALAAGGLTIAVLPGPVDNIYPATNIRLAEDILANGGALVSEYAVAEYSFKQNFIARNRLVAGLAQAVLITEAAKKSGSLHTARFALEQGKDVLAVPGNITSKTSVGTNNLIKAGATPITSYADVLHALGLRDRTARPEQARSRNQHEQIILDLLQKGLSDGEQLLKQSGLTPSEFNQAQTMLELAGKLRPLGANQWSLR